MPDAGGFRRLHEHTDAQIGRLVDFLERRDQIDDTLFIVLSDNGASGEGGEFGSENEYRYFLGLPDYLEENRAAIDDLGGPWTHNHYPSGWAQAGNTPLKLYKKYTFGGGVRAPLIMHWPAGIGDTGGLRHQFHHAIDLAPTMLDLADSRHRGATTAWSSFPCTAPRSPTLRGGARRRRVE